MKKTMELSRFNPVIRIPKKIVEKIEPDGRKRVIEILLSFDDGIITIKKS